ncbi:DMT family transporter [Marinobacter sp.]|uniref:DMT family transporter n=1 Tax=Marinobacter sp. TaxID=50741 RepID=UPI003564C1ED
MKLGVLFGVAAGASWGMVFLSPALLPSYPPLLLTCGRFVAYGVLALVLVLPLHRRLREKWQWQDLSALLRLSVSSNILYFLLLSGAVQRIGIAATSLIIGLLPLTITLLGRGETGAPPLRHLFWPLLSVLAGMVCINIETILFSEDGATSVIERVTGLVLALSALACWSWYATDNARSLKRTRYDSNEWSLLVGLFTGALAALIWGGGAVLWPASVDPVGTAADWELFWAINIVLALVSSWFGYLAWNLCTRRLPLTLTGQMVVFETLFALLYGFAYLQRLPGLLETLAIVLLLGGVSASVWVHGRCAQTVNSDCTRTKERLPALS